jgi:heme/copper-type cytochrome/quinol oxidase subunit 2
MLNLFITYADSPINFSYGFQDPATQWMLGIVDLHDNIVFYLIIILTVVLWFLISALYNPDHLANLHHGNLIEVIWTITPAMILWVIGLPSLKLLYMMDEILDAELTVKAIANQWYWSYEYTDYVFANGEEN